MTRLDVDALRRMPDARLRCRPVQKIIEGFRPDHTLLAGAVPLYGRASGSTWRAADLPAAGDSPASA